MSSSPHHRPTLFDLRGKTALITGASSGFGHHFAGVLAAAGANVVLGARRVEKIQNRVDEINSFDGGRAVFFPTIGVNLTLGALMRSLHEIDHIPLRTVPSDVLAESWTGH